MFSCNSSCWLWRSKCAFFKGLCLPFSMLSSWVFLLRSFTLALAPVFLNPIVSCLQDLIQYSSFPSLPKYSLGVRGSRRTSQFFKSLLFSLPKFKVQLPILTWFSTLWDWCFRLLLPSLPFQSSRPISDTVLWNPAPLSDSLLLSSIIFHCLLNEVPIS